MLSFESGSRIIPHPDKAARGGEDGLFVNDDLHVLAVADGVGSWAFMGVDPGIYARKLMRLTEQAILTGEMDPVNALRQAYDGNKERGTSTACVAMLNENQLHSVNLGDSGYIIIRDGQVFYSRKVTIHSFNFPLQLGEGSSDVPEDGAREKHELLSGDIIVMGTDGLWDNLFEDHVAELTAVEPDVEKLAGLIAEKACFAGGDAESKTPWSGSALGGKPDDITVIASRIVAAG